MNDAAMADIDRVLADAEQLYGRREVDEAFDRMAAAITDRLGQRRPLLLCAMTGGMVPTAMLLPRLAFPLQVDYLHLTRYGARTAGGTLQWVKRPPAYLRNRVVLLIDDLLDHGLTLGAAVDACAEMGAAEVLTAVLVIKDVANRPGLATTDFHGLATPDRYLFGYGMDYKTWWRNGPGIYAAREP